MLMNTSPRAFRTATLVAAIGFTVASCADGEKDSGTAGTTDPACATPTANAGVDTSGTMPDRITLDGTASVVCDPETVVYLWSFESVPVDSGVDAGDLNTDDPAHPWFDPDLPGTYVMSLVVSDTSGVTSAVDLIVITIASGSQTPTANCGGPYSGEVGQRIDVNAAGSSDPEGDALSYLWSLSSIPNCSALNSASVFNGDATTASFVPDCSGTWSVGLTVSDGQTWSEPMFCAVDVGDLNDRPVADAGTSTDLSPCTEQSYELNGYGSWDPEGAPLTYAWGLLSVPSGSTATIANISDPTIPNPKFTWDTTGEYTFELRVNDGTTESAPDIVVLNFQDVDGNSLPIANAGEDQTINKETECETASYVFTCEDCPSDDVEVDATASDDPVDGDNISFLWSDPSRQLSIENVTSPVTTIIAPGFASEYGVVTTRVWDVTLSVSDCADTATDTVRITYNCTGTYH